MTYEIAKHSFRKNKSVNMVVPSRLHFWTISSHVKFNFLGSLLTSLESNFLAQYFTSV